MNPDIKKQWVAALRSGEYRQGIHQLRTGDFFCCLGVLCNLHAQAHPEIAAAQPDKARYLGAQSFLPSRVMTWAGHEVSNPIIRGGVYDGISLSSLNDGGKTFSEIADIIEKNL